MWLNQGRLDIEESRPFREGGPDFDVMDVATVLSSGNWFNHGVIYGESDILLLWTSKARLNTFLDFL